MNLRFFLALSACCMFAVDVHVASAQEAETADESAQLTSMAMQNRHRLDFDGDRFSGPAWKRLLDAGRNARFFLLGEEHGIAENPKLAAQLFRELTAFGYRHLVIEVSPPVADLLDTALADDGLAGLRQLFSQPGGEPAFFGMREEADFLAAVRTAAPQGSPVLWGVDYEVASDRPLLQILQAKPKPEGAQQALAALAAASAASWEKYAESGSPQFIFSFAGDPELVRAVSRAWPDRDAETGWILDTLEETFEINALWVQGRGWESNNRRAALLRSNFLRHWQAAKQKGTAPRVMAKLGASHLVRGRNMTQTFDLGTLLPEIAAAEGGHAFSAMVVPGPDSPAAVLDPSTWTYSAAVPKDAYTRDIASLTRAAYPDAFTLIDLAPLRPVVYRMTGEASAGLQRVVYGYDVLLVMSGSTASAQWLQ